MASISRSLFRTTTLSFAVITLFVIVFLFRERDVQFGSRATRNRPQFPVGNSKSIVSESSWKDVTERLDLTEDQCRIAFPELSKDIDEAAERGTFRFERSNPDYKGLVQGRIKDGKVCVRVSVNSSTSQFVLSLPISSYLPLQN